MSGASPSDGVDLARGGCRGPRPSPTKRDKLAPFLTEPGWRNDKCGVIKSRSERAPVVASAPEPASVADIRPGLAPSRLEPRRQLLVTLALSSPTTGDAEVEDVVVGRWWEGRNRNGHPGNRPK
jgi:hypothetical protein